MAGPKRSGAVGVRTSIDAKDSSWKSALRQGRPGLSVFIPIYVDLPKTGEYSEVIIKGNALYVWTGEKWESGGGTTPPLAGTKVYYVANTSGALPTRKLTFIDGVLVSET